MWPGPATTHLAMTPSRFGPARAFRSSPTTAKAPRRGPSTRAIDAATNQVTEWHDTPYGSQRGADPVDWPEEKGFVGGTEDSTLGLTQTPVAIRCLTHWNKRGVLDAGHREGPSWPLTVVLTWC